jgi:rhodanese-related sulfurtransferase
LSGGLALRAPRPIADDLATMTERRPMRPAIIASFMLAASLVFGACGGAAPAATPSRAPVASVPASMPDSVSIAEAAALRDSGALLIDVREPSEWAAGHISGATLIPLGQLASRLSEVPRDRTIVTVCRTGIRAAQGRDILRQAGLTAVTSMAGGMTDWIAAGRPVVTGP